jgi:hydrogenase maturation protein HypF
VAKTTRAIIAVHGIVQGVGFRPFIHQRARLHGLKGWVLNSREGVRIEVEGLAESVDRFVADVREQPPVLSLIEDVQVSLASPVGYDDFEIRRSDDADHSDAQAQICFISPDVATCPDCLRELMDPEDRRYLYPFTNCTNCGPRFTIIEDTPYDRAMTTMRVFPMCAECAAEYGDVNDRRYHAQPNACWKCGPQLRLEYDGETVPACDLVPAAQRLLAEGRIVAVKGLGGFHLACDAEQDAAVQRLRERKGREEKPLAIMCRTADEVAELCRVSEGERRLLEDPRRPIVLLRKREGCPIAESVAPGNPNLGVMLPYTPLHTILMDRAPYRALVMTSGNPSEEPLTKDNFEARTRLRPIADALLLHNREIHARCDDSVAHVMNGRPVVLRRSRGYAPFPIRLGHETPTILACGAELKSTFCLVRRGYAFVSQHLGDLKNAKAFSFFEEEIAHFQQLFRSEPDIVAHDLHPQYLSTQYALSHRCPVKVAVQHHHAHVASCMVENGVDDEVLGIAFDGLGLGDDDTVWGGEFLLADRLAYRRVGRLRLVPMPGGDAAVREPWRMAVAFLNDAVGDRVRELDLPCLRAGPEGSVGVLLHMIQRKFNSPLTSSLGRLFDAVASLVGIRQEVTFEGQAAMQLEMEAVSAEGAYLYELVAWGEDEGSYEVDTRPIIRGVLEDLAREVERPVIAGRFHNTVVAFTDDMCRRIMESVGKRPVALSGGCFQNAILFERLSAALAARGLTVYTHHTVPPNDGGLSLGQAGVANARWAAGEL